MHASAQARLGPWLARQALRSIGACPKGEVAEWFKAAVLKTAVGASPPWVRIPPSPPPGGNDHGIGRSFGAARERRPDQPLLHRSRRVAIRRLLPADGIRASFQRARRKSVLRNRGPWPGADPAQAC